MKPAAVQELATKALRHIGRNPGVRADQIAEALGATTIRVSTALRLLKKDGRVRRRGNTRATTYRVAP